MGNQLTKDKVLEINSLDPLPYEEPEAIPAEEMEVIEEEVSPTAKNGGDTPQAPKSETPTDNNDNVDPSSDDEGQITLF